MQCLVRKQNVGLNMKLLVMPMRNATESIVNIKYRVDTIQSLTIQATVCISILMNYNVMIGRVDRGVVGWGRYISDSMSHNSVARPSATCRRIPRALRCCRISIPHARITHSVFCQGLRKLSLSAPDGLPFPPMSREYRRPALAPEYH